MVGSCPHNTTGSSNRIFLFLFCKRKSGRALVRGTAAIGTIRLSGPLRLGSTQAPITAAGAPAKLENDRYPHQWRHGVPFRIPAGPPLNAGQPPRPMRWFRSHVPPVDQQVNKAAVVLVGSGRNRQPRCAERWQPVRGGVGCLAAFVSLGVAPGLLGFRVSPTAGASVDRCT